jgi:hypothetical protein
MIYLKLRQTREIVNHKQEGRLYAEACLQVRRRKRKKFPSAYRNHLERPLAANQVWSIDFAFDRPAEGRVNKNLTVVDDATHEAVAIVPERAVGGQQLTHILEISPDPMTPQGYQNRQREGVLQSGDADVGTCTRCKVVPHRARQTQSERHYRIVQRLLP